MKKSIFVFIICVAAAAPILVLGQGGQALFNYIENPTLSPRQSHFLEVIEKNPVNVSFRIITVNHDLLEQNVPIVLNFGELAEAGRNEITIQQLEIERRDRTGYSWRGRVEEWPLGGVNFVYDNGFVHGTISVSDALFGVEPIGEGLHVLIKKSPSKFSEEGCRKTGNVKGKSPEPGKKLGKKSDSENIAKAGDCRIRLLVAFTDDVLAAHANPRGEIQLATDSYNTSNQNSNVDHRVELARIMKVNYAESGIADTDLVRFRTIGDGFMDQVHTARDLYDADLCCLITETLDACGLASDIGSVYATAFQVTRYDCAAANLSFAHEFGHLLNARHDTFVDATAGVNHGLVNMANSWRTVMSYNDECDCSDEVSPCPATASRATPGMPSCTRIQWWSNPAINFNGNPTGITTRCDNHSALNAADNGVIVFENLVANKILSAAETVAKQEEGNLLAEQSIENNSGIAVQYLNDSKGTYRAGNAITLRPGFWAKSGSDFRAFIDGCSGTSRPGEQRESLSTLENSSSISVFPNPFDGSFSVQFEIPTQTFVSLSLFDAFGRQVRQPIAQKPYEAGEHVFEMNDLQLPPGIYYLELKTPSARWVQKLVKVGQ